MLNCQRTIYEKMLHITTHDVSCQYQVTVTQRWNEKQVKASERAKEFANSKDVHLEVDDYLLNLILNLN